MRHGQNGSLVDFFDTRMIANRLVDRVNHGPRQAIVNHVSIRPARLSLANGNAGYQSLLAAPQAKHAEAAQRVAQAELLEVNS